MIPGIGVTEVSGFHGAVAIIAAVNLAIAIVEAASAVIVMAVHDPVLPLRLVIDRCPVWIVIASPMPGTMKAP